MKRYLIYILFWGVTLTVIQSADAQHYIGMKGGTGIGMSRLYPKPGETKFVDGLYMGAVSWKYYSPERFVGGIGADIEFIQKGFIEPNPYGYPFLPNDSTTYHLRSVNSVQVPIMWQPHFYLAQQRVRVFVNLAVTFSYNINSSYQWWSEEHPEGLLEQGPWQMDRARDVRWGYGLSGGFGVGYLFGRWETMVEGRYYFGYSDILRSSTKNKFNTFWRSPLDNFMITAGVYYRLGNGGILAAPSKRTAQKMAEREARKAIPLDE